MAVQVNPIAPSLPATTAIQDPATRRFAQAVEDALRALRSEEGAVESLKKAADAMNNAVAGGTPPSIAQWLFSSELYQKLTSEIARVDTQAKQDVLDEALARQTAIDEINATLATIQSTAAYDPLVTYAIGDMVTYDGKLYQAILATTGNLPTNTTYWKKVGDYATLGDVVAAHTLEINDLESRVTTDEGNLTAEIADRQALATQVRGAYTGTDVNLVSQGLIYSERVARATADSNEVAARQSLSAKLTGSNDPSGLTLETLASGLLFDEKQARVSGDGANASSISALRAQVGVTEAGALTTGLIMDEKNVRASNDLAIVSAVNTALAQITGVSTSISQSGENLIANWTTAQADKWSQIESEVLTSGGQTIRAALLQESQTRASLEGDVYASYTLRVDANGNIAGFGLAADANSSEFIVRADKFAVVTDIGGTPHVPFAIGPSGAEFTGLTSWGNVNGRPDDPHNLCTKSSFEDGQLGAWVGSVSVETANTSWSSKALRTQARDAYLNDWFSVTPGEKIEVEAALLASLSNHALRVGLHVVDKLGTNLSWPTALSSDPGEGWAIKAGTITIPANASKARCFVQMNGTSGFGSGFVTNLRYRRFTQITPSNVSTYIDSAAIGNAQIGGDIWSSNFVAGSAGWRIYRSGSAEFRDITARGDIEASSLKANTAMVNTLHIQGNAVTIPVSAFTAGAISANSYPAGFSTVNVQSATIYAGGAPVVVTGSCTVNFNPNISSSFKYFELVAPSGAVIARSGVIGFYSSNSAVVTLTGVSTEQGTYTFRGMASLAVSYSGSSWEIVYRTLWLLGTKR